MKIKTGSGKQLDVPNIHAMIDRRETILRTAILEKITEVKRPVSPTEISLKERYSDFNISDIMQSLAGKGLLAFNKDGAIFGVYPVSALVTRHSIKLQDGRSLYAMCAIDSLGIAYEFNQGLIITSSCGQCNKNISIQMENKKITTVHPATTHVLHVDIQKYRDWASSC